MWRRLACALVLGSLTVGAAMACGLDVPGGTAASPDAGEPPRPVVETGPPAPPVSCTLPDGGTTCAVTAACHEICIAVADRLNGVHVDLPCFGPPALGLPNSCATLDAGVLDAGPITIGGLSSQLYEIRLRVRGVVGLADYMDAAAAPATGYNATFFVTGHVSDAGVGTLQDHFGLDITEPPGSYWLNGSSVVAFYPELVDYETTILARAGSQVTLTASSSNGDGSQNRTLDAGDGGETPDGGVEIIVPGVKAYEQPFNGQFVEIEVLGVRPAP